MATENETELDKLRSQLRNAENRLRDEQASSRQEKMGRLRAERQVREEQKRNDKSTFRDFLKTCHSSLFRPVVVQDNKTLTTRGSVTNPKGRKCPTFLRPWEDFSNAHLQKFDEAYEFFHPTNDAPPKLFPSAIALEEVGRSLCVWPLSSERDLEIYQRLAVEEKVAYIISQLVDIPQARQSFALGNGIEFANHANSLADNAQEVMQRTQQRSRTDQICVRRNLDDQRSMAFIIEYKPPHKVSVEYLRAGLRSMNLWEEVVQRHTIPQNPGDKLNYNAEKLTGAMITQTFEYMIENGLEYSYATNGKAFVFLRILEDDPTTVYYYLAEPDQDVDGQDSTGFRYPFTAVARVLGFCLMALRSEARNQAWRERAAEQLHTWSEEFEDVIHEIPSSERHQTPPASAYKPPSYPTNPRSPYLFRTRSNTDRCEPHASLNTNSGTSSEESSTELQQSPSHTGTPSRGPSSGTKRKRVSDQPQQSTQYGREQHHPSSAFCTQKCLIGLQQKDFLDEKCPNYSAHRCGTTYNKHHLNIMSFHRLLQEQLSQDMDNNCEPLHKQGARGALFRLTLASHGYIFVGKGTVEAFLMDIRHEGQIYKLLRSLQGSALPVCLGNLDLKRTYYLDIGVRIIHMLLLSWGGPTLVEVNSFIPQDHLEEEKRRSIEEICGLGVDHKDLRPQNMLWNDELRRVLLIDFERSAVRPLTSRETRPGTPGVREVSLNGKRRCLDANILIKPEGFRETG